MSITIKSISTETLKALLSDLRKQEKELSGKLADIQSDIRGIEQAIGSVITLINPRTQSIRSDSDYSKSYTVSRGWKPEGVLGYTCECPSFRFASGTDANGHCKHIIRAMSLGAWR